jgi:sulfur-carrier protein adenylyltransferase/sulfurtransferase
LYIHSNSDVCALYGLPWIYSAISAFEGQISVFNFGQDGPDYRDLLPVPPSPGDVPSCAEGGVLGVLPGTMGCLQATEAIKLILGHHEGLLSGRVLIFHALSMKFSEVGLQRSIDREPIQELCDYHGFCGGPKQIASISQEKVNGLDGGGRRTMDESEQSGDVTTLPSFHTVEPRACFESLVGGWTPWVLDVRLPTEHAIVHLPFTDGVVPHRNVRVTDIPANGDVLVYCKGGVRGSKACTTLIEAGVDPDRLYNLKGGIMKWQKDVDPAMPRY